MKKYLITIVFLLQTIVSYTNESVVCVHGFFRSYKCMIPIGNIVRNEGMNVYLWDYPSRSKTIEEHAERLVEILNRISRLYPNKPIHFVTHSLGGVIVRVALTHPNCPEEAKIGKAVLLAPPNKGAILARKLQHCPLFKHLFGKKAGYQLLTLAETDMENIGKFPVTKEIMVIAGTKESPLLSRWLKEPNDGKVTVEETRLSTPHQHHVLNVSHSWIMTSRESIKLTKNFLLNKNR